MKVTTKGGDKGMTHSCDMLRIGKNDPRMFAVVEIDMLHADMGLCLAKMLEKTPRALYIENTIDFFRATQQTLISKIMGEISSVNKYEYESLSAEDMEILENVAVDLNKQVDLKGWVLYGERGELSARLDKAAKQCRRAELYVWKLKETPHEAEAEDYYYLERARTTPNKNRKILMNEDIGKYLNRLSDVLFLLARL